MSICDVLSLIIATLVQSRQVDRLHEVVVVLDCRLHRAKADDRRRALSPTLPEAKENEGEDTDAEDEDEEEANGDDDARCGNGNQLTTLH